MLLTAIIFTLSILGVAKSADWFLSSAEKVGLHFRLPKFVMGVLLVGLGTSLPELMTSVVATLNGETSVAISNVLGSNIANILLIIGISTIAVGTIRVQKELVNIDLPLLLATSIFFILLVFDGQLNQIDGVLLLVAFASYLIYSLFYKDEDEYHGGLVRLARAIFVSGKQDKPVEEVPRLTIWTWLLMIASVVGLAVFSNLAIDNLLKLVAGLGIAVEVISFFALAVGTSLPELVVSIKALRKGDGDVVIGNIIGSSMFNILLIGGVASVMAPQNITLPVGYWMFAGVVISALLMTIAGVTRRIHIWEGAAFLFVYAALAMHIF